MEDNEKQTEEQGTEDTGDGDKSETFKAIDEANFAAKRLEEANAERRNIIREEQDLLARKALGGNSEGGTAAEEKKEETPKEYSDRAMRGG